MNESAFELLQRPPSSASSTADDKNDTDDDDGVQLDWEHEGSGWFELPRPGLSLLGKTPPHPGRRLCAETAR